MTYVITFIAIAGFTITLSQPEKNIGCVLSGGNNQLPACIQNQASTPLAQATVISRYTSALLSHPLKREKLAKGSHLSSLSTLNNYLKLLWNTVSTVISTCHWKYACACDKGECARSHNVVPCGNVFHISRGAVDATFEVEVPFGLHVNITLLYMKGHVYTPDCHVTQKLKLAELSVEGWEMLVYTICGKTPVQNFYMAASRVRARLHSRISYESAASFCVIYQPTAINHALVMDAGTVSDMSPNEICSSCSNKCLCPQRLNLEDLFLNGIFVYGHTWVYTWAFTGEALKTPTVEIQSIGCDGKSGGLLTGRLRIIDGPFSVYDQHFSSGLFTFLLDQGCGQSLLQKSFTGSIGDLVLQAIWDSLQTFEVKFNYYLVDIRCPADLCKLQKYRLSNQEPTPISAASGNQTSQTRLLVKLDKRQKNFIELQDAVFHYDGLGHLQCAIFGIYIYELEPLSLITRIYSPWTSAIWSRTSKRWGSNSLHLGKGPLLILIRSYRNAGGGYVSGTVQLSGCKGIVNSFLKDNSDPEYNMRKTHGTFTFNTYSSIASLAPYRPCAVIREARVDGRGSWLSQEKVGLVFKLDQDATELSIVNITGCFDLPLYVNVYRGVYNYMSESYIPCTKIRLYKGKEMVASAPIYIGEYAENRSCFRLEQAFTEKYWGLDFEMSCFLLGLKLTVDVRAINVTGLNCSSSKFLQQPLLNFRGEVTAFASTLPCGGMEFYGKLANYEFRLSKPTGLSNCCYLKVKARASQRFFHLAVKSIAYGELFNRIDLQHRELDKSSVLDVVLKTYIWNFSQTSYSTEGSSLLNESLNFRSVRMGDMEKIMQRHYTMDTSIMTFSFGIGLRRSTVVGPGEYLKISFRHFSIGRPVSHWPFENKHRIQWHKTLCIDIIRSCYKAYKLASSTWKMANGFCSREEMHLISVNTETEWHLVQYWFSKDFTTAYKLRKTQLIFLGTQISSVSSITNLYQEVITIGSLPRLKPDAPCLALLDVWLLTCLVC